jgi:GDP-4-dehydro-6-deoxy-D-mannose reductase
MRVLITGATGFVGGHLIEHLLAAREGAELFGLRRWSSTADDAPGRAGGVRMIDGDLLDAPSLLRAVAAASPEVVFHLAASSSVAGSWDTPVEIVQSNVLGTLHLLEALRQLGSAATLVVACSAESYGRVAEADLPLREEAPFRPVSPYAVSKAAVDMLAYQYHVTFGLRTVRLRLFNHCGPRQSDRFVVAALARQVAEIEAGQRRGELRAGNLDAVRDFVDVRDVARAYALAAERGRPGEAYNVATGTPRSIRAVLDGLLALSATPCRVTSDAARMRPADIPALVGDATRFRGATGWAPEIPFDRTLRDTLEYWRRRVRASGEAAPAPERALH